MNYLFQIPMVWLPLLSILIYVTLMIKDITLFGKLPPHHLEVDLTHMILIFAHNISPSSSAIMCSAVPKKNCTTHQRCTSPIHKTKWVHHPVMRAKSFSLTHVNIQALLWQDQNLAIASTQSIAVHRCAFHIQYRSTYSSAPKHIFSTCCLRPHGHIRQVTQSGRICWTPHKRL